MDDKALQGAKNVFVQEFITNPLLIQGRKFDVGVYVVITSFEPLRLYALNEVQVRFCPEKYHPFDPDNPDKYVVSANYKHLWQVEGVESVFPEYSRKETLNLQLQRDGHDVE